LPVGLSGPLSLNYFIYIHIQFNDLGNILDGKISKHRQPVMVAGEFSFPWYHTSSFYLPMA
jgi:hypothetical protein